MTSDRLIEALRQATADRYAVERPIGRGGAATVFLARDLRHPRAVAIKVLDPELGVGVDRFRREIEIAARLSHPNILPLLDSGSLDLSGRAVPFYVMPYVAGETLRDRLNREGALPLDTALALVGEIGGALDYAHRADVIHRDIKPENILLSDGHAVVADFGIARALDEAQVEAITAEGLAIGTPQYMSPEQVTGETNLDGRTDLYALGCVAFEMLAGRQPFADQSLHSLMTRRLTEPPPRLADRQVTVSPAIDRAIHRAMSADRADRYGSIAEFLAALRGVEPPRSAMPGRGTFAVLGFGVLIVAILALWRDGPRGGREQIASLAIRPLAQSGDDSTAAYLNDGIGEGVVDLLRRIPRLSLAAPTVVSEIVRHEPALDLVALGKRLAVGAVLTWEMRRRADSVHLRAELVEVKSGRLLWGQSFGRRMAETHRLEEEIARAIADSLRLEIAASGQAAFPRRSTVDPEAYDAYLRGRHVWIKATPLRARAARENADSIRYYAERALARDSTFAGAYFLIAAYASVSALRGWGPLGPLIDTAQAFARRAIELDPGFADPHGVLGIIHLFITDDWVAARREFETAVRLNPDLGFVRYFFAQYLGEVPGAIDSAISHLRRGFAIDAQPFYLNTLGDLWMRAGRYDSAIVTLRQAIALDSLPPGPHLRLVRSLEQLGRYEEAVAAREAAPDSAGSGAFRAAWRRDGAAGYRRVFVADLERRIRELERAPRSGTLDSVPPLREHRIATLYAQLGRWTEAMDWVLKEYDRRPGRFRTVLTDPVFRGLSADPRFADLRRRDNERIGAATR